MSEDKPQRPWEEDYGPEEDLWQYGSSSARGAEKVDEVNVYTRQQAFERIAKRMDR